MAIFGKDLEKIGKMENNVEKTHDTIFFVFPEIMC